TIAYDFALRQATVTDRRGHLWTTTHTPAGQAISWRDPYPATTTYDVDDEGRITQVTLPLGRQTTIAYPTDGPRRAAGNALAITVTADSRGANGSSETLTTAVVYDDYSNQPVRITDPRGTMTEIERDGRGLARAITEAFGSPEAGTTLIDYDDFGRAVLIANPNQHLSTFTYHEVGPS